MTVSFDRVNMQAQIRAEAAGAILFDATACPQVEAGWFDPAWWRARDGLELLGGGRGGVAVIATPCGEGVLRHYRRGGLIGRFNRDRYLWTGRERTRSFAEFRLLAHAVALGLPAPEPLAARYRRQGPLYTADLITRRIAGAQTLAGRIDEGRASADLARETGALVARFHRAGFWHADLNAHNVLIAGEALYLIDFDRGRLRDPAGGWREANLARLRRSLLKIGAAERLADFEGAFWQPLLCGYERTFAA